MTVYLSENHVGSVEMKCGVFFKRLERDLMESIDLHPHQCAAAPSAAN